MTKHVYDTLFLIFIARIPWIYICCLMFSSPLWLLLLLVVSDIYVLSVPFYLLSYHKYSLFGHKRARKVSSIQFSQDLVLTILLSTLISSIHSIAVYIVTKLALIPLLSDYAKTEHLVAPIPLPILIFAFFPLGFCIQKSILLFGPHKAFLYITFTMAWFVADGVFFAELNEFFTRELSAEGYSGTEVRVTPTRTEIIIRATHTQEVLGEKGRRIRELTSLIQKRFKFPEGTVELYAEKVQNRGLCAVAQCESLKYKLLAGLAVRRAAYGVLRFIMESGAKGCEVVISGKLRAARAKSMKFTDGFMIHSGQPSRDFIDSATRHVLLRQGKVKRRLTNEYIGVLGVKVKIMLNEMMTRKPLPDSVVIIEPKPEEQVGQPSSEDFSRSLPSDLTQQTLYRVMPSHSQTDIY
ncbi:hypothetical protein PCK2_000024 [Pneumocystis canis]|nr:hypothetical protein PCK2_000024 [Pneumocystis canis]